MPRKRTLVSVSLDPQLAQRLRDMSEKYDIPCSRLVERALWLAMTDKTMSQVLTMSRPDSAEAGS